jgi:hypothetical protein
MIRQPHGTEAALPPLPQFPLDHFLVGFDDDFQGLLAFLALYFFVHLAAFPDAISPALHVNLNRLFGRHCEILKRPPAGKPGPALDGGFAVAARWQAPAGRLLMAAARYGSWISWEAPSSPNCDLAGREAANHSTPAITSALDSLRESAHSDRAGGRLGGGRP